MATARELAARPRPLARRRAREGRGLGDRNRLAGGPGAQGGARRHGACDRSPGAHDTRDPHGREGRLREGWASGFPWRFPTEGRFAASETESPPDPVADRGRGRAARGARHFEGPRLRLGQTPQGGHGARRRGREAPHLRRQRDPERIPDRRGRHREQGRCKLLEGRRTRCSTAPISTRRKRANSTWRTSSG